MPPLDPPQPRSWNARAIAWWGERLPLGPALSLATSKSVPIHRRSWVYLLGGVALFLFGLQVATGCLLMLRYQPTEAAAHESVTRIMTVSALRLAGPLRARLEPPTSSWPPCCCIWRPCC